MKKIAIRADGGSKLGMGHIMRTLVLARELAKTNEVFYVCKWDEKNHNTYKPGIDKIIEEGYQVIVIDEEVFFEKLSGIEADCLITDSYNVDEEYFDITKSLFYKTGYIDDMNLYKFNVDFIINQNINAEYLKYNVNQDAVLMLGPQYTMIREEFKNIKKRKISYKVENILITLGGSDINDITYKLLEYIVDLDYKFHVVIGNGFLNKDKIIEFSRGIDNIKLYFNPRMSDLMEYCDIAISACGSTLYELCISNVPVIGIIVAENQKSIADYMGKKEMIINLGDYKTLSRNDLVSNVENLCNDSELRNRLKRNGHIINKHGVVNIAERINKLLNN